MNCPIRSRLDPVRLRQERLFILRTTVWGLLASSFTGVSLGCVRFFAE